MSCKCDFDTKLYDRGKQVKLRIINNSSLPADFQKCFRCQNRGRCKFIYRCFKIRETITDGVEMEANVWSSGDEYAIVKNEKGVTFKFLNFGTKSWDVYVAAGVLLCYMQQLNLSKQYPALLNRTLWLRTFKRGFNNQTQESVKLIKRHCIH